MPKRQLLIAAGAALLVLIIAAALAAARLPAAPGADTAVSRQGFSMGALSVGAPEAGFSADEALGTAGRSIAPFPPVYPEPTAGKTAAEVDQKVIKTGYLDLVVEDVGETVSKITALAAGKAGFVQSSSVSEREDGTKYGSVTVRVPAKEFEPSMAEIKAFATLVQTESATGQDVTEQYTDLQAQLRNAKAQEEEYLRILKQARNVEEILQVQQYLSSVRAQIESLQGRIQYLENVTAYSTISIALSEEPMVRVPTKEFRPLSTIKEAFQALVGAGQQFLTALIWITIVGGGILIPFTALVLILLKILLAVIRKIMRAAGMAPTRK